MGKPFRILSLSGGGIRGIFQASFLEKISRELKNPLHENFDMVCGTSTGAIVGMAVATGIDMKIISNLYKDKGAGIFKKRIFSSFKKGAIYDQNVLKKELESVFENQQLKDSKTKVLITSASISNFDHKVFSNFPTHTKQDANLSIVDIILSSAAAPTYFSPFKPSGQDRHYVDGGLWANTPSSIAILFANKYLKVPIADIRLISIGTGDFPNGATIEYFEKLKQISFSAIETIFELMFSTQSSFADLYAKEVLGEENYLRISANLDEPIALDDVKNALLKLPAKAEQSVEINNVKFKKLVTLEAQSDNYIQDVHRENLISDYLVNETGLTAFFPTREHYNVRINTNSIHTYIETAKNSLIMVSISLVKGFNFDDLRTTLERKLENKSIKFEATISFLNPEKTFLMESLSLVFEKNKEDLVKDINDGIKLLKEFREKLSKSAQLKLKIRVHNSIPFGSAIIIDHDKPYGKIQIETKAYKLPMGKSFAFEVVPMKSDGFFYNLLEGYQNLLLDGKDIN